MPDTDLTDAIARSADRLRGALAGQPVPRVAVVLGSGWDVVAERIADPVDVPYAELPAFPVLGVAGHAGAVRLGTLGGRPVALLRGRKHAYETGDPAGMKGAIRSLAALGTGTLVLTNAAGSLNPEMRPGTLMMLSDHLNIVQRSPLHGETDNRRFVDLGAAYDPALRDQAAAAASEAGIELHEGIYAWVLGPQFETPAEIRMLQRLGADAVGMSTVPETILARHAGLKVLAFSLFTNMGAGLEAETLSHAHTLAQARAAGSLAAGLLEVVVPALEA